jgi:hypothetical protein
MREIQNGPLLLSFIALVKVEFQGSWITSHSSLTHVRWLNTRLDVD